MDILKINKLVTLSDAVILILTSWINELGALSLEICVPNFWTINNYHIEGPMLVVPVTYLIALLHSRKGNAV